MTNQTENTELQATIEKIAKIEKETGERKFVICPSHGPNAGKYLIVNQPPFFGPFWNTAGQYSRG